MTLFRVIPAGDLALEVNPANGKRRPVLLRGPQYVRQKLQTRFKFFLAEWFRDLRQGIPYYRDVFVRNPDLDVIRSVFRDVILSVVEITSIARLDPVYDPAARTLAFDFEVVLTNGDTLIVQPNDAAFIITLQEVPR